jgi:beta-lactamase class A
METRRPIRATRLIKNYPNVAGRRYLNPMKGICSLMLVMSVLVVRAQDTSQVNAADNEVQTINRLIKSFNARIGVTIAVSGQHIMLGVHGQHHFPMQSVFKFHLALTVLHLVDKGRLSLEHQVFVSKADVTPKMYSPLRDKYPDGNVSVTVRELLSDAVSLSDNVACDVLFRLIGGTNVVNRYIHSLGISDVSIVATEEEMHKAWPVQYNNWTTPYAAVWLLKKFDTGHILSPTSRAILWDWMTKSVKADRIRGLLPAGTVVAHKPGTSDTNEQHVTAATNDIGIVVLPDGRHLVIAVFVSDSKENDTTNAQIIAQVAKTAWNAAAP